MLGKLLMSLFISTLSFLSVYGLSTDFEYTLFEVEGRETTNPDILTNEEMIGKIASDYFEAKAINDDVKMFIDVPGVCYQPVVFTGDQFYLYTGINKTWTGRGMLFMGAYTEGTLEDTAIIYGHHMKDGTMFAGLKNYQYEDFFQKNDPIRVFDGENLYYYKPYTSLIVADGKEAAHVGGREGQERYDYYKSLYDRSTVKMEDGLEPDFYADMLFLQTCEYVYDGSRQLVGLYRLKTIPYEGEGS